MTSLATHTGFAILFWFSIVSIFYVYIGYPLLLYFFSHKRSLPDGVEALPHVTLLISAYNEQGVIAEKLRNTLALEYPHDRMRIIVVSDCSDDGTDKIVELFSSDRVCLVRQSRRLGKSAGL